MDQGRWIADIVFYVETTKFGSLILYHPHSLNECGALH
jgi:hypothetical protein